MRGTGKLPDLPNERSASAEKRERIKAALASAPDGDSDEESEFEVRSQVHEHYIEYSLRHSLRLDLGTDNDGAFKVAGSKLAPRDQMLLLSNRQRLHDAVKGASCTFASNNTRIKTHAQILTIILLFVVLPFLTRARARSLSLALALSFSLARARSLSLSHSLSISISVSQSLSLFHSLSIALFFLITRDSTQ
jgi:hypothetical protein